MEKQIKEFKCDICGMTFKDEETLRKHRLIHMTMENKRPEGEQTSQIPLNLTPPTEHQLQPVPSPEPNPQHS